MLYFSWGGGRGSKKLPYPPSPMTTSFQVFEANLDCFPLVLFKQYEIFQVHLQAICNNFFFFFLHNTMEF